MIRRYVWICGAVMCLGIAAAACGKGSGTDGMEQKIEESLEFHGEIYLKSEISEETLKWLDWYQSLPEEQQLAVSSIPHDLVKKQMGDMAVETDEAAVPFEKAVPAGEAVPSADILLTEAPELVLSDALSSNFNHFALRSGNYEWNVMEGGEVRSMVACGSHPLDAVMERTERLKVLRYQRMDEVLYVLGCVMLPDRLTLVCWDISALGDVEAEAEETRTYEKDSFIYLKPDKVYEITAVWADEQMENRGYSGLASYALVTE